MNKMVAQWEGWQERFATLAKREKVLVFAAVALGLLLAGWQFLVEPTLAERDRVTTQAEALAKQLASLHEQQNLVSAELATDPGAALRQQERQLEQRLQRLDAELEALTTGLIGPEAMVDLLQALLRDHDGVRLHGVQHEAPRQVSLDGRRSVTGEDTPGGDSRLFAHGVSVRISGDYMAVLAYLQALEKLDDRLGWQALDYEVAQWPRAEVRVRLQTLSLHKEWLGV